MWKCFARVALITSSCWSLLRCSCVADSLQVARRRPPPAANLSSRLLTRWNPSSPPHRPTCPSSSITIRAPGSVRRPLLLCPGASAEPFPSALSPPSPGQVWAGMLETRKSKLVGGITACDGLVFRFWVPV